MAIAVFILDLSLPLGVAGGVPYVALVLVGWWFPKRWTIVLLAAIGSVLTAVGYVLSPEGAISWVAITNRGYAVFVIWIAAVAMCPAGLVRGNAPHRLKLF